MTEQAVSQSSIVVRRQILMDLKEDVTWSDFNLPEDVRKIYLIKNRSI